ncbi:MAG: metallophosphoesterase, partial [Anaerocolumna sp.]
MKKLSGIKKIIILALVIISGYLFCIWQNNSIVITETEYTNAKIPDAFNDYVICQISDLHNKEFGENQRNILNKISRISPDIIVITGDIVDRRKYNLEVAMEFVKGAIDIAPIYYVSGNHEAWSNQYTSIKNSLVNEGVVVLDDTMSQITINESSIDIVGVSDPDFLTSKYSEGTDISYMEQQLKQWSENQNFTILLSHRPELFHMYVENNMDLVFSGHAHGGQIRLPFVGGLVAPDQGVFPKYTSGQHKEEDTTMFVSRGLGN